MDTAANPAAWYSNTVRLTLATPPKPVSPSPTTGMSPAALQMDFPASTMSPRVASPTSGSPSLDAATP